MFSRFINCSTGSKSRNVSHIVMKHFPTSGKKVYVDARIYTEEQRKEYMGQIFKNEPGEICRRQPLKSSR